MKKTNLDKLELAFKRNAFFEGQTTAETTTRWGDWLLQEGTCFPNSPYRYNYTAGLPTCGYENTLHVYWQTYLMKRDYIYIRISNKTLYKDDLWDLLADFIDSTGLKFDHVSKLDICEDCDRDLIKTLERKFKDHDITWVVNNRKVNNRTKPIKGAMWIEGVQLEGESKRTLIVKQKEGMTLAIYNKAQEIIEKGNAKDYIADYWTIDEVLQGTAIEDKNMWRAEVRMNRKNIIDLMNKGGINDTDLLIMIQDKANQERIFDTQSRAILRWHEGKKLRGIADLIK